MGGGVIRGVIRCRFVFSGKNDEPTPDFENDERTPDFARE